MEGALEGDDADPLGLAVRIVVAPRRLDGGFQRLGPGVGEEHLVGEGRLRQALAEPRLAGDLVEVRQVPDLLGLVLQRRDEVRVGMAEGIDGDAGAEIEIALAVDRRQPDAFAALEAERGACVGLEERRCGCHVQLPGRPAPSAWREGPETPV